MKAFVKVNDEQVERAVESLLRSGAKIVRLDTWRTTSNSEGVRMGETRIIYTLNKEQAVRPAEGISLRGRGKPVLGWAQASSEGASIRIDDAIAAHYWLEVDITEAALLELLARIQLAKKDVDQPITLSQEKVNGNADDQGNGSPRHQQ